MIPFSKRRWRRKKCRPRHAEGQAERNRSIAQFFARCVPTAGASHSHSDKHPRGRKLLPEELRRHKQQWLGICADHPEVVVAANWISDVGPLQALIDELEYNQTIAAQELQTTFVGGAVFQDVQFSRAISAGAISILTDDFKQAILRAYALMNRANQFRLAALSQDARTRGEMGTRDAAIRALKESSPAIETALEHVMQFLAD